jgi:hypothetical protein
MSESIKLTLRALGWPVPDPPLTCERIMGRKA